MNPIVEHDSSFSPSPTNQPWTAAQSRAQFAALAKLRWHIFRNAFRRKGGGGEFAARIILFPILGLVAFGPIIGAGYGAYFLVSSGRIAMLPLLTWAIFALWMLVVLNIAPPGLSFDINTIIRFPLSFPRYLTARIVFGLLSASTVIGTLAILSADIGIAIANSRKTHFFPPIAFLFGLLLFGPPFFSVYPWLMHRESRAENLTEAKHPTQPPPRRAAPAPHPAHIPNSVLIPTRTFGLNSTIIACLQKEFIYLRRNINQLYGFVAPVFMAFLFANPLSSNARFGNFNFPF